MGDDPEEYAEIAAQAYRLGSQQNLRSWEFDPTVSNSSTSVYYNPQKNEVALAHRGTSPKYWRDHVQNGLLAMGLTKYGNRYKRSKKATEQAMEKYQGADYVHTGHSAGGTTAILLGNELKQRAHAYNPGMSPVNKFKEIHEGVTIHHTLGDPVSQMLHAPEMYLKKNVKVYMPKKKRNPHSLENFYDRTPSTVLGGKKDVGDGVRYV